jgi:nitrate/nitrite transporter NarK
LAPSSIRKRAPGSRNNLTKEEVCLEKLIGGFLETNIGVDPVTVGTLTVVVLWMPPLGGVIGGFLADKIGKTNTISA